MQIPMLSQNRGSCQTEVHFAPGDTDNGDAKDEAMERMKR